jgi:hypothetical protein
MGAGNIKGVVLDFDKKRSGASKTIHRCAVLFFLFLLLCDLQDLFCGA